MNFSSHRLLYHQVFVSHCRFHPVAGNFKFIAPPLDILSPYREDRVKVDCRTNVSNAEVHLLVIDFYEVATDIMYDKRFNESLKRTGQVFTFFAHLKQGGALNLWCRAKKGNRTICIHKGELIIKESKFC